MLSFMLLPIVLGVLCGSCTNGTGFSALLNKCVECKARNVGILAALGEPLVWRVKSLQLMVILVHAVIADVLVIGFLLVLKVGPPSWFYPTLFYVQVRCSTLLPCMCMRD